MDNTNPIADEMIIECPHCLQPIIIEKINCGIFRHGIYKHNGEQIPPHLNKPNCEYLIQQKLIYGCGKPFQIIEQNKSFQTIICDYI